MRDQPLPRGMDLANLATDQYGVVSVVDLKRLGYSKHSVSREAAEGRLHTLHRGVYAVGHTDLSPHGRCLAAVFACGPGALLSHWSAGWLLGLLSTQPIPVHVTTPIPRKGRPPIRIHHSRTLTEEDATVHDRIPVTSVARTALDLAARIHPRRVDRLLRRAEELELFDLPDFQSVLARNQGHRGAAPLRGALTLYEAPRFTRSQLERDFLAALQRAGIPDPVTAYIELGYELDFYWPDRRFAVELDTFETHGTRASFESDRLREEDLKLAGIEMDRITGYRFEREPDQVLERVGALLARRPRGDGRRPG